MNTQSRASKMLTLVGVNLDPEEATNSAHSVKMKLDNSEANEVAGINDNDGRADFEVSDSRLLQMADEQETILLNHLHTQPPLMDNMNIQSSPIQSNSVGPVLENYLHDTPNSETITDAHEGDISTNDDNDEDGETYKQSETATDSDSKDEKEAAAGSEAAEIQANIEVRKRKKRRHVTAETWTVNSNRKNRQEGRQYCGKRKLQDKWDYKVTRTAKTIKAKCHCDGKSAMKCNLISEEQRNKLFKLFWKFSWSEKSIYLTALLEKHPSKRARHRKSDEESRRQYSYIYFLETATTKIRVCKTMFCNTFSISPRTVGHWISNKNQEKEMDPTTENETDINISANSDQGKKRKIDARYASINERNECLKTFFQELPKMESHYCRKSSSKLYLEPIWKSKSELYRLYKDSWCKKNNSSPVSIAAFANHFSDMNLSLFSPKKDECDTCVGHKTGNIADNIYQLHLVKKEEARYEKDADKSGENNKVFTMDLQSVLLSPMSNVSALYYKTKLVVHNFTIFDIKTKEGYCFLWHEGHAGLSSNSFASIVYHFLITHVLPERDSFDKIILYSDGCTCQNRNAILSSALVNFSQQLKITIEQKYLEKGHTQMECDSMHSTIERKLRNRNINVPADYVEICRTARLKPKPYVVEYLDNTFFKDFKKMQIINSIRPGRTLGDPTVTDIRALQYNERGQIQYKIRHTDEWKSLPCRYFKKDNEILDYAQLPMLHPNPLPIKSEKYQHLMELKKTLEKDYHNFYDSLIHL